MTLLDLVLFLPLLGFLLLLLVPKDNPQASRMGALMISLVIFVVSLGLLAPYWFANPDRLHVLDQRLLDQLSAHPLSRRPGRAEPVAGAAVDAADADLRCWSPGSPSIIASRNSSRF